MKSLSPSPVVDVISVMSACCIYAQIKLLSAATYQNSNNAWSQSVSGVPPSVDYMRSTGQSDIQSSLFTLFVIGHSSCFLPPLISLIMSVAGYHEWLGGNPIPLLTLFGVQPQLNCLLHWAVYVNCHSCQYCGVLVGRTSGKLQGHHNTGPGWRQVIPLKHWYVLNKLHDIKSVTATLPCTRFKND
jgi:hypothetical protein